MWICIVIVVLILGLDIFTQNYTKESMNKISEMLANLKEEILKTNKSEITKKVKEIDNNWNKMHDKLAYYIEHDELEKVDTAIITMKSYIETEDYSSAVAELDEGKFVLEHIQKKNAFNLQNVFQRKRYNYHKFLFINFLKTEILTVDKEKEVHKMDNSEKKDRQLEHLENLKENYYNTQGYIENNKDDMDKNMLNNLLERQQHREEQILELENKK